jgi:hypothetical protein
MTLPAISFFYGGLIFGALPASQMGIRAITRSAPASSIPVLAGCCRP